MPSRPSSPRRARTPLLAVVPLLLLVLTGCGGGDPEPSGPLPMLVSPSLPAVASGVPQAGQPQMVSISISGGRATGDTGPVPIKKDTEVRITVLSDVTDVLLLEGYQRRAQVSIGSPVQLEFIADRTGTFDVVLERSGMKVTSLVVS